MSHYGVLNFIESSLWLSVSLLSIVFLVVRYLLCGTESSARFTCLLTYILLFQSRIFYATMDHVRDIDRVDRLVKCIVSVSGWLIERVVSTSISMESIGWIGRM